ncbi:response regulator [Alcanivorax sp. JB21]|uniref:ATP-binding protein n=1 Tax=Alcanivorax limicola TaxID=2874102 RepID=UPI001CBEB883|nr:ATP-binding protein [Alcanivorax limicola]MBZ2189518.1 response regulator [Alcanivorax limicola]
MIARHSIRQQLRWLGILPAVILLLLLLGLLTWQRFGDAEAELSGKGQFMVRQLAMASEYGVLSGNHEDLRQQAQLALQDTEVRYVLFADAEGGTLLYQGVAGAMDADDAVRPALREFSAPIVRQPLTLASPEAEAAPDNLSLRSQMARPEAVGEVRLGLSGTSVARRQREILLASLGPALVAIIAALWIAGRMARSLSAPITRLSRLVRVIRGGGYHVRGATPLRGELGALQRDINELAAALERARREQDAAMDDLRDASQRAEAGSQAKSEFLAMMSHELRTPMNGVLGMLQLLAVTPLSREQQEYAGAAVESTNHLLEVINDILDFSRIESGRMELEQLFFSPEEMLRNCMANFRSLAEQKQLTLALQGAEVLQGLEVRSDPTRMRQVLSNLVANAIKFTEQGRVTVRVDCQAVPGSSRTELRLSVEDTGIGIAPDKLPGLFNAFSQVDSSTSRRFGGAGLGLAISRRLCSMLGGQLTVSSTPGQGTCFTAVFMLDSRTGSRRAPTPAATQSPTLQGRVLLVEDNDVNRMVAEHMLSGTGALVVTAEHGDAALTLLNSQHFDCVLMDVQMPVLDGLTATRRWRQQEAEAGAPRVPIIALTANALSGERERCLAAGMDDYLAKPFQRHALLNLVARYLDKGPAETVCPDGG